MRASLCVCARTDEFWASVKLELTQTRCGLNTDKQLSTITEHRQDKTKKQ